MGGERIRTSSIVIMHYESGYLASQNKWRRFVKAHFSQIGDTARSAHTPFCASVWGGMSTDAVIDRVHKIKEADIPAEYIWMDAGWYGTSVLPSPDEFEGDWYNYTGDWRINEAHHPDKMQDVVAAIKKSGKKFLLWFEPERVINTTPIAAEHPDYFISSPRENDKNLLLNLGDENAWRYCYDLLAEKIETLRIDCYRQDFNFPPLCFWQKNDAADRKGITEIKYIMGLYRLWDALLTRFPHLVIDNCASGGRRIDIETLRRSVPLWRSDVQCHANHTVESAQMQSLGYGLWMPYSATGTGRITGDTYRLRSAYSPGLVMMYSFAERDAYGETEEELQWYKKHADEFLRLRPYFTEDIHPLTEPSWAKDAWCAMQYHKPSENDGMLLLFRREALPYTHAAFALHALDADKDYVFTDIDTSARFTHSGKSLLASGFPVEMQEARTAKIFVYTPK